MKLTNKVWSPYYAGGLVGLSLILSVGLLGGWFGSTTTFARIGSLIVEPISNMNQEDFFTMNDGAYSFKTLFNFQTFFVLGIPIGAFVSAKLSGDFKIKAVPETFAKRFGTSKTKRFAVAFLGANVMVIGARFAGGCASWWGISSASKLDIAGFATMGFFFLGGILINKILFRKGTK